MIFLRAHYDKIFFWAIVVLLVVSLSVEEYQFRSMQDDAARINIAGRQRMLSQRIAKLAAQIELAPTIDRDDSKIQDLRASLDTWSSSENLLKSGQVFVESPSTQQSQVVRDMYRNLESLYQAEYQSATSLLNAVVYGEEEDRILRFAQEVQVASDPYLEQMNILVFRYNAEADRRLWLVRLITYIIDILSLVIVGGMGTIMLRYKREESSISASVK